ncbi:hypothetical protein PAESOLCIP111_02206 [Paenibacillus solanacearum]|uniref:Uncharacterized protein n=1 Tax=Paenibacillus solanacearum TaxID=2048548 RepID=A0A916NI85_9BACL|nr:hypothetical protein [Paenibacillus solanacearum]CAG7619354.1 hypothetical protein PAESOLCIP111_02206 [Paenibacillus solanacearum]
MNTLLQVGGTVTSGCSQSHITYTVHLRDTIEELHAEFAYEPKTLEDDEKAKSLIDEGLQRYILPESQASYMSNWQSYLPLKNLMTLSFDDENGFRGAGHRHDPEQHLVIASGKASPGLIPGPLPRGQLRITISLHCIVTETCRYRLHVWEGGDGDERTDAALASI